MGLARFALGPGSQAGPYGAACAFQLPERLTAVALVSALAPFDAPGVTQGYVRVSRSSGQNPFVTYAVINDGAEPGQVISSLEPTSLAESVAGNGVKSTNV